MPRQPGSVLSGVKSAALVLAATLLAAAAESHEVPDGKPLDAETEALVRRALPVCPDVKFSTSDFTQRMPQGLSARFIHATSENHACDGQYLLVTSGGGTWYLGTPWFIGEAGGATIEEKLKSFAWTNLRSSVSAVIDRKRSPEGLFPVALQQTTERGKVPLEGLVDADGRVFFMGRFQPRNGDPGAGRIEALQTLVANAPARGAQKAAVTVVEFSDFQCPSCKRSSALGEELVAAHPDQVRYIRFDLPLIETHPWAFGAAIAGRAIYRQKPELFWEYKKQVYENQDRLNAFVFDDFARGFAEDHGLDMTKYDADLASEELRNEILKGVGAAFTSQVRATPTFMVNGTFVATPAVKEYVEGLLR